MGFWIFMLLMDLLIPLTMIGLGRLFMTRFPRNINAVFGYRTTLSMKNKDTWEYAHRYCGKLWFKFGLALLPVSVISLVFVFNKDADTVGAVGGIICMIQMAAMIGSIFPTEAALKRTFGKSER